MKNCTEVGVVIGRFQTPWLHDGHRYLIDAALERHEQVLVLIGTRDGQPTKNDPLDYDTRRRMIEREYPGVHINRISDAPGDDDKWSTDVDRIIGCDAIIYGSRDSFIPSYTGRNECVEIPCRVEMSATALRAHITNENAHTVPFREGVIYAQNNRHPTAYSTVDVAIMHSLEQKVLVGRKAHETKWRFVGGFVDPEDENLERTARREVIEETGGIEVDAYKYIGSQKIDDARYRGTPDGVMTTFFVATYIFGAPRGTDDIAEVRWINLDELMDSLMPNHRVLGNMLLEHLEGKR